MSFQGKDFTFNRINRPDELTSTEVIRILNTVSKNDDLVKRHQFEKGLPIPLRHACPGLAVNLCKDINNGEMLFKGTGFIVPKHFADKPRHQLEVYCNGFYILQKNFKFIDGLNEKLIVIENHPEIDYTWFLEIVYNPYNLKSIAVPNNQVMSLSKADPVILNKDFSLLMASEDAAYVVTPAVIDSGENYTIGASARDRDIIITKPVELIQHDFGVDEAYEFFPLVDEVSRKTRVAIFMGKVTSPRKTDLVRENVVFLPIINSQKGVTIAADYHQGTSILSVPGGGVASIRIYSQETSEYLYKDLKEFADYAKPTTVINPANLCLKNLLDYPKSKDKIISKVCNPELLHVGDDNFTAGKLFVSTGVYKTGMITKAIDDSAKLVIIDGRMRVNDLLNPQHGKVLEVTYIRGNIDMVIGRPVLSANPNSTKVYGFIEGISDPTGFFVKWGLNNSLPSNKNSERSGLDIIYNETEGWFGDSKSVGNKYHSLTGSKYSMNLQDSYYHLDFTKSYDWMEPQILEVLNNSAMFNIPYLFSINAAESTVNNSVYAGPAVGEFNPVSIMSIKKYDKNRVITSKHIDNLDMVIFPNSTLEVLPLTDVANLAKHILNISNFIPKLDLLLINGKPILPKYLTEVSHGKFVLYDFPYTIVDMRIIRSNSDTRFIAKKLQEFYVTEIQPCITTTEVVYNNIPTPLVAGTYPVVNIVQNSVKGAMDVFMNDCILNGRIPNIAKNGNPADVTRLKADITNQFKELSAEVCLGYDGPNKQRLCIKANKSIGHRGYISK